MILPLAVLHSSDGFISGLRVARFEINGVSAPPYSLYLPSMYSKNATVNNIRNIAFEDIPADKLLKIADVNNFERTPNNRHISLKAITVGGEIKICMLTCACTAQLMHISPTGKHYVYEVKDAGSFSNPGVWEQRKLLQVYGPAEKSTKNANLCIFASTDESTPYLVFSPDGTYEQKTFKDIRDMAATFPQPCGNARGVVPVAGGNCVEFASWLFSLASLDVTSRLNMTLLYASKSYTIQQLQENMQFLKLPPNSPPIEITRIPRSLSHIELPQVSLGDTLLAYRSASLKAVTLPNTVIGSVHLELHSADSLVLPAVIYSYLDVISRNYIALGSFRGNIINTKNWYAAENVISITRADNLFTLNLGCDGLTRFSSEQLDNLSSITVFPTKPRCKEAQRNVYLSLGNVGSNTLDINIAGNISKLSVVLDGNTARDIYIQNANIATVEIKANPTVQKTQLCIHFSNRAAIQALNADDGLNIM